ncbi:MAG: hypothetical protein COB30_012865 [Ectothiorhodospiraceae bacterium]|nr:hypothetical protein [Ectothiorhodospiraceae bacterium]
MQQHPMTSRIQNYFIIYLNPMVTSITFSLIILLTIPFLLFAVFFSTVAISSPINTTPHILTQDNTTVLIDTVDKTHQGFMGDFQRALTKERVWDTKTYKNTKNLLQSVKTDTNTTSSNISNNHSMQAANIIFNNIALLKEQYDAIEIFDFITVLLTQNDTKTANELFSIITNEGDRTLISNAAYLFAVYDFNKGHWDKTLELLTGIMNDLPDNHYNHALLMNGMSLQKTNKHRESIPYYTKVTINSKYYNAARLNMAIANIRQGWWTDGHILIQSLISASNTSKNNEVVDRLYLTLGYSYLKQEYYRNSRDTFRNIHVNSIYASQGILGIALTAANQKDYIGALTNIRYLKEKKTTELSIDESYLLTPYFYEKLGQSITASTGYLEAINYYQKRISDIEVILESEISFDSLRSSNTNTHFITIHNNQIMFSEQFPEYFLADYEKLKSYQKIINMIDDKALTDKYHILKKQYESIFKSCIHNALNRRITELNSYMNQSRFGLARLYDNNLAETP